MVVGVLEYYKTDNELPDLIHKHGSFGIDLHCAESVIIHPGGEVKISLGVIFKGEKTRPLYIVPRSSFPEGLIMCNHIGIIDWDYEGIDDVVKIRVRNVGNRDVYIDKGQRICQVISPNHNSLFPSKHNTHWNSPNRGGFGSTGK